MSSREIAELTGKQHKDVLHDIRTMLDHLELTSADFSANLFDSYGRTQPSFNLPKDLTTTLVSGYSIPMRHKIVVRWIDLESQQTPVCVPTTFREALLLAAAQQEQLETAQLQISIQQPAVEFVERFVAATQTQSITETAKSIRVKPRTLSQLLIDDGVLYRRKAGAPVVPCQRLIDSGYFIIKQHLSPYGQSRPQTRVTTKGVMWLAEKYGNLALTTSK